VLADALDKDKVAIMHSIDLSAAFDILKEDLLVTLLKGKISESLFFIISDFL